jgi:hypothetical protein
VEPEKGQSHERDKRQCGKRYPAAACTPRAQLQSGIGLVAFRTEGTAAIGGFFLLRHDGAFPGEIAVLIL